MGKSEQKRIERKRSVTREQLQHVRGKQREWESAWPDFAVKLIDQVDAKIVEAISAAWSRASLGHAMKSALTRLLLR